MSKTQKTQAETLASRLLDGFRRGDITYSQAVTVCSECVDVLVGEKAFRLFRKEAKRGGKK
jgi:hypothetical protein